MQTNPEFPPTHRPIPACPAPAFCAAARLIVNNPGYYAGRPIARRLAWTVLMAERGKDCDQSRLAMMQSGRV